MIISFLVGVFMGVFLGVGLVSMLVTASQADEQSIRYWKLRHLKELIEKKEDEDGKEDTEGM